MQQTANGVTVTYQLDMNMGLTQVLDDGTSTYLYGMSRIGETDGSTWDYYMVDALGSVRQLTNDDGVVTLAGSFTRYGKNRS